MSSNLPKRLAAEIRLLRTRHGRRGSEYCLCDGLRACSEVLALAPDLVECVILREDAVFEGVSAFPPFILPYPEFAALAPTVNSQGIMVLARRPEFIPLSAPVADDFILVLDRVGDPGNSGTILRTARAAGLHEVWLTRGSVDPFSDKVLRSASGAQFALKLRMAENTSELVEALNMHGYSKIFRTLPAGGENLFTVPDLFERSAIVFGCEATGVAEIDESRSLHIPMPGDAESLNVAQAATILIFEYVRRITS